MKIRVGIVGYGNLGRGAEAAVLRNPDMELGAVFTRRDAEKLKIRAEGTPVAGIGELGSWKDRLDVLLLCGGSASDLPVQTPELAREFHVVDSFDTHAKIPEHFAAVDAAAREGKKAALISVGWDPGIFSLNRLFASAILPEGKSYTFWGRGVSQGHSDACRRVEGVLDARQYTVPVEASVERVRRGEQPELTAREMHTREVFLVAAEGADRGRIEREIRSMPNYFADYDTSVHFISAEEMKREHGELPHGGFVIRSGVTGTGEEHRQIVEYGVRLESNPEFTGSILAAYARALFRLAGEGKTGCMTVFDVAPAYLSPLGGEELRARVL